MTEMVGFLSFGVCLSTIFDHKWTESTKHWHREGLQNSLGVFVWVTTLGGGIATCAAKGECWFYGLLVRRPCEVTAASTQCFHPPLGKRRLPRHGGVVCKFIWKIWKMDRSDKLDMVRAQSFPWTHHEMPCRHLDRPDASAVVRRVGFEWFFQV